MEVDQLIDTATGQPLPGTPLGMALTAQARATPDRPAMTIGERTWSFAAFEAAANRRARQLMRQGVAAVADLGQQALHAHGPGNLVAALGIGPGDAFRQHDLRADSPKGGQSGIGKRPGLAFVDHGNAGVGAELARARSPVSYTHLTLPTKRIV